jgi:hypothetical protein
MSASRQSLRRIANRCRAIPGRFGLRMWRVYLDTSAWSESGHIGDGTESTTSIEILESGEPPKVTMASEQRIALGFAEQADIEIGPITPEAGTAYSMLNGFAMNPGQTLRVRIVHEENIGDSAECVVRKVEVDSALRIMLLVKPIR